MESLKQSDPFDQSIQTTSIIKGRFQVSYSGDWTKFAMRVSEDHSYGSFGYQTNDILYSVDGGERIQRQGRYATSSEGFGIWSDWRWFSFRLSQTDVDILKEGKSLKMAGKALGEWYTETLDLSGFTQEFDTLCNGRLKLEE